MQQTVTATDRQRTSKLYSIWGWRKCQILPDALCSTVREETIVTAARHWGRGGRGGRKTAIRLADAAAASVVAVLAEADFAWI